MRPNRLAILGVWAVFAAVGCHNKRIPVTTNTLPPPTLVVSSMDRANEAFVSGNYDEAARAYENYLKVTPSGGQREEALFYLGVLYAIRPAPDWQRAVVTFKQLTEEYPNSPFKVPTTLVLSLHTELDQATMDAKDRDQKIKQLATELERLKKIDSERRKRP
jgi:tetratricopeptide (TPR) repeat protein